MDEHSVDLLWLPLGAGDRSHLVTTSGRVYEWVRARQERRLPQPLFHTGLEVTSGGVPYTVEMGPRWQRPSIDRGAVVRGPVFFQALGRSRYFQYEIRRWRGGVVPDRRFAVESPVRQSADAARAVDLLAAVPQCPAYLWGRDELGAGEMWNSNSIVAWLLTVSGHDIRSLGPPAGGRAPGWGAGMVAATGTPHGRG